MEILVCPVCKGGLGLTVDEKDDETGEIVEGSLHCEQCSETYPISDAIPNLLPPDQRG